MMPSWLLKSPSLITLVVRKSNASGRFGNSNRSIRCGSFILREESGPSYTEDINRVVTISDDEAEPARYYHPTPSDNFYKVYDVHNRIHYNPLDRKGYRSLPLDPHLLHDHALIQWMDDIDAAPHDGTHRERRRRGLVKSNMVTNYEALKHITSRKTGFKGAVYDQEANKVLYRSDIDPQIVEIRFQDDPRGMPTITPGENGTIYMQHIYDESW